MLTFAPPWWLRNPHAQTVWRVMTRRQRMVALRRELVTTPDGDELVLDHLEAIPQPGTPHLILLHGLEGSSYSVYIQGLLAEAEGRGWTATAVNFRSCARDANDRRRMLPNRRPRFYHSGETTDFDFVVRLLAARHTGTPLLAFGGSLGGNALLKWLGENRGQTLITAAAAMSVPYDLGAGGRYLERGAGPLYVAHFLKTLRPKIVRVVERFPELRSVIPMARALGARTFYEFDDAATGPLHGFTGADDYYNRSSSIHFLPHIDTPVLCVSAEDDPFLPREALARARSAASDAVEFRIVPHGGHAGFVRGTAPWRCASWAEETIATWLEQQVRTA